MSGDLVKRTLVPVQVFGADYGYGLSDAVSAWSDCNRAVGRIYRVDDIPNRFCEPGDTVEVFVREADVPFFDKVWGEYEGEPQALVIVPAELFDALLDHAHQQLFVMDPTENREARELSLGTLLLRASDHPTDGVE